MKAGIIGCGAIAKFLHAPEYQANPCIDTIVFYDRNPERAAMLADLFDGNTVSTVEELLTDPAVNMISDCSSNENHHIFTTKALQHGKHVLCEKPIAVTVEQANEMIAAQKASGKKLMVNHNQRFFRAHQQAKKILERHELGKVLTFRTTFGHAGPEHWGTNKTSSTWFFKKDRSGLGVAGDLGVHKLDLLHYLLDDEVEQVSAFTDTLDKTDENGQPIGVCDNAVASLKTRKGRLGTASFSWTYYGEKDDSTVIYCEHGAIKIYHHPDYQIQVLTADQETINYELQEGQTDQQADSGVIDAFIDCIRLDKMPPVTGEEALTAVKAVFAILEAAETERVVTLT
ncbi:oxidoreductase [Lentibacillus kapialis]|uniref:Oxidoreductase n=1 Tax=Lentibacillus kapialis TaxID=340214 RepID=A0A917PWB9_9BACI|nr:Gfo/Idh/MocA family oxidoreductase [Lentibacillus kapialis]GGJ94698.1 oxidoreductase [Lentibacillus kapialis]